MKDWQKEEPENLVAPSMEVAQDWLKENFDEITNVMHEMKKAETRAEMQKLQDEHYKLVKYRRSIQNNITTLFRNRRKQNA